MKVSTRINNVASPVICQPIATTKITNAATASRKPGHLMGWLSFLLVAFLLNVQSGLGQVSITTLGAAVTENFDVMTATGTSYPANWTGLRAAGTGTIGATLNPVVDNGASSTGAVFNVGTTSATDRALGTLASGTTIPAFGVSFVNNTGITIISISLSAVMEQWRSGSSNTTTEKIVFEYSTDATSLTTGTWTALPAMDLVEKLTTTTVAAAVDGNLAANKTAISGTITGLSIANTTGKIWLRWTDANDAGSDGMYAIDDFSLTATGLSPEINIKQGVNDIATAGTFGFGNQLSGTSSAVTSFTIENTGTATLNIPGSPKIVKSGTNASEFTVDETSTSATVAAAGSTTFTITFSPVSAGAKTAKISIANDDPTGGENPYEINLTGTGTASAASDIIEKAGYTYPTNIAYGTYQATDITGGAGDIEIAKFTLRDGGGAADADNLGTTLTQLVLNVGNFANLNKIAIYDDLGNEVAEQAVSSGTITFGSLSYTVNDDASRDLSIRVSFKPAVTDNQKISIAIGSTTTASVLGSDFTATNAGGASTTLAGADDNKIVVTASAIQFSQQPALTLVVLTTMTPAPALLAVDNNGNTDLDYGASVTMTVSAGTTTFDGTAITTLNFLAGSASFANLVFNTSGIANKMTATSGSFSVQSTAFDVTSVPLIPQTISFTLSPTATYGDLPITLTATATSGLLVNYTSSDPTVASVSGSTLTILKPGSVNIIAHQPGDFTYDIAPDVSQPLTISRKILTLTGTVTAQNKIYDGNNTAAIDLSAASLFGVVIPDNVTVGGGGFFASTDVANGIGVTANLLLGGPDEFKYTLTQPTGLSANITQASQAITGLPPTDTRAYQASYSLTATGGGSGNPVTYVSSNPSVVSITGGNVVTILAGSGGPVTITASQAGSLNYSAAPDVFQTLTVTPASQTITFNPLPNKLTTDVPFTLSATASSGFLVSYNSSNLSVATISGSTVTIVGAGSTIITATQGGTPNYAPATPVQQAQLVVPVFPFAPVPMASQPGKSYTENFTDIATWGDGFASGNGANRWKSVAASGAGTIPNPNIITASTATFQVPPLGLLSGGVHKGTDETPSVTSIILLSTGSSPENSTSSAIDFFMDFTGEIADKLSFDAATIINSTGDRKGTLRVYASTDGTTWTELSGTNLPFVATNGTTTSASISNIQLPAIFNNSATARLRFYYHNGTGGTTGSRPKISIDNLTVTALLAPVINSSLTASGSVGTAFNYNITATNVPTSYNATGLPAGLVINTGTGAITGTPTTVGAGTYNVSIDATNAAGTDTKTLVITVSKGNQTILFSFLVPAGLATLPFTLGATASSGLTVSYTSSDPLVATVSGNTVTIVGAGNTTITAFQAGDADWNPATPVPQNLLVNKADQTITFNALPPKLDNAPNFQLTATGGASGNPIVYTSSNPVVAIIVNSLGNPDPSGDWVDILTPGSTTITASQAGNTNYNAATDVPQIQVVNNSVLLNQTITFNPLTNKTYGDLPFALTATASSTLPVTYVSSNPLVATVSGNTVTVVAPGTTNITASQAGDINYNPALDVIQPLIVDQKTLTVTGAIAQDKPYDGNITAVITGASLVGVISPDAVTVSGGGTFADPNVANNIPVAANLSLGGGDAAKYLLTQPTGLSANITIAGQTITFGALAPKTAADAPFTLNGTASSGLTVTYTSSDPLVATVSGNTVTIVGVGSTIITAQQAGNVNYSAATDVPQTLVVTIGSQTISFGPLGTKFTTDAPFALTGTASSGLAVSYASSNPLVATVAGNIVTIVAAGTTNITASQPGNVNFTAATPVVQPLTVVQPFAPVPMAAQPLRTYTENFNDIANWANGFTDGIGANRWLPVAASGSGSIPDPNLIITSTTSFTTGTTGGVQKGSSDIILFTTGSTDNISSAAIDFFMDYTGLVAGTMSFDVTTLVNTPAGTKYGTLRVYASTNGTSWTELTGANLPYITTNAAAASASISNIQLPASFNNSATARLRFYYHNGGLAAGAGNRPKITIDNLTVNAINAPVITSSLTDNGTVNTPYSYTIIATNTPTSYNATGLPPGLGFSGNTISGTPTAAGPFNITIEATNAGGTDSKILALTIAPANQVITGLPLTDTKTFGDAPYNITGVTGGGSGNPVTFASNNPLVATISGNQVTITGGGTATITASQAGNANYNAAPDVSQLLTVNQATQTITFNPLPVKLDTDPAFTLTATASSGLAVSYSSSNPLVATVSGNLVTITGPGITSITASQPGNANYFAAASVSQQQLVYSATAANQTITFNPLVPNKTYGDLPFALTATASSSLPVTYVSSDPLVATVSGNTVTVIAPGTTNITASQAGDFVNFNPAPDVTQSLTVDPKTLTVTGAVAQDKFYDGNPSAIITGSTLSGVIFPDDVTVSGGGTFISTNVANGITVNANLVLGGADMAKYSLTQPTGLAANIMIASQTITFNPLAPKTTADIPFALTASASSGLPVSYTSSNILVATISGNTVTIVGDGTAIITASQAGNGNYLPATPVQQPLVVSSVPSTVCWNFGTTSGNAAPSCSPPAGLSVSNISVGNNNGTTTMLSNLNASNVYGTASGQFNAAAAAVSGSLSARGSINPLSGTSTYFEFTLTPASHKKVTLNTVSFGSRSTATGPQSYSFRSSLDNYAADLATGSTPTPNVWGLRSPATTGSTSGYGSPVTYRLYGYDGVGAVLNTANWRIDDLALNLLLESAPACTGTPDAGTASAGTGTFCLSGSTTITLTGYTDPGPVAGISLQWHSSTDNSTFTPIPLETNPTLATGTITQTMYYYCVVNCFASGESDTSNTVTVTVNQAANAGTVSGTTPLCVGATTTYTSTGDAGGSWSSSNPLVASVDPVSGLVTALAAGPTNIIYTATGCTGPAVSFQTLTVNPVLNPGTVTGPASMCVGSTATFITDGDPGGTWSSDNILAATVDPLTGVVTAVGAGTVHILYAFVVCPNGVSQSQDVNIYSVPPAPSVTVADHNDGTSTLTAGGYTGSLLWSTTETINPIIVTAIGTYTVTQTENGCTSLPGSGIAAPSIPADPAVTGLDLTDLSDVSIPDANSAPFNQVLKLKVPVFNLNQVNPILAGSTTLRIDLGSKFIVDPGFTLGTASLNNYFNWSQTIESGHVVIYGDQYADIPADFDGIASFQVIADLSCSSAISANIIVDNHASTIILTDEDADNNSALLQYSVVVPAPTVVVIQPTCLVATGTITITAPTATGMTYTISGPSVNTSGLNTGVFLLVTPGSYNVTAQTADGCISAITVAVVNPQSSIPLPIPGTVSGISPLCIGQTTTYSSDGDPGGTWSSTNPLVASVDPGSGLVTALTAGSTDITYTVTNCNGSTSAFKTLAVSLNANAGIISGISPLCIGQTTTYSSDGDPGGNWSSTNPAVASVDAFGLVNALSSGSTDITYTTVGGCNGPVSSFKTLTVSVNANAGTVTGATPKCIGQTTTYTSNGDAGGSWSSTNPAVATVNAVGVVTTLSSGSTDITYTVNTGCNNPVSSFATLTVDPNAGITSVTGLSPVCIGATPTYTANSVVLGGSGTGAWSSSNPAVATVDAFGIVTAHSAGTADIIYTITGGCGGTASAQQSINVSPDANPGTVSGISPLCIGASALFTSNGDAGGTWSSSNPAVATVDAFGLVTALSAGSTNIIYTLTSGCNTPLSASQLFTVNTVLAAPVITVVNNHNGTSTLTVNSYTGTLLWSTNETTQSITVSAPGTYTVTETVNGCTSLPGSAIIAPDIIADPAVTGLDLTDLSDVSIPDANFAPLNQVLKLLVPVFNLNQENLVPAGSTTLRIDLGSKFIVDPGFTLATASLNNYFNWTQTIESGHVVIYGDQYADIPADFDGIASFQVIANVSCSSVISAHIIVDNHASIISLTDEDLTNNISLLQYSIVVPAPTVVVTQPTCLVATGTITVTAPTAPGMTYYISGPSVNTSGLNTGVFLLVTPGSYNVTAQTADGCISAITVAVVDPQPVVPLPVPGTISGTSPLCIGQTATYSSDGDPGGTWSSTNTVVASVDPGSGLVTALSAGTTDITYTVTNCNGPYSSFKTLTVNPDASIASVTGLSPVCIGATPTYTANSVVLGGGTGAWSSSNPAVATVDAFGVVTALSAGTADIIFTITGGCGGTTSQQQTITVDPDASIASVTGVSPVCIGATPTYTANSVVLGGSGIGAWSSSNPAVATVDAFGVVTALSAGTTDIIFTITGGCGGTTSQQQTITVDPNASIASVTGLSPVCIGATPTYTANSVVLGGSGGIGAWSSSNPAVATVDAFGVVTALSAGTADIIFTITGGCGGTTSQQQTITVDPNASIASVTGLSPVCIGATPTYTANSVVLGGSGIGAWSSSNPAVATVDAFGVVTALSAGTADIIFTITGGCGGPASAQQPIVVSPNATAGLVSGPSPLCVGVVVNYTSTGDPGGTWSSSNPAVASVDAFGVVTAVSAGSANIIYTVNSGCFSPVSASQPVTVNAVPAAPASITVVYNGDGTATLTVSGYTGTLLWNTNETTPSITVNASGTYSVTQTENGCTSPATSVIVILDLVADPAVTGLDLTDLSDVSIPDANAAPYNQVLKLKVPVFNLNQANPVPAGSTTLRIDLGSKFIVDPGFTLGTASLNNYFNWTQTIESGHVVIYGDQYATIPADFDGIAVFQIIANRFCSSVISANIIVDNHASVVTLFDEDPDNNIALLQYTIVVPAPSVSVIQPTCLVATGTITITAPIAAGMTYSIDGSTYTNTTGVFTPVIPGTYNVTAQAADGCFSAITVTVVDPQPSFPAAITYNLTQPDCFTATGNLAVTAPLGVGLSYSIDGFDYSNTTGVFPNLNPGSYNLTAQSAGGCITPITVIVVDPQPVYSGPISYNVTQPDCATATGSVTITAPLLVGMTYSVDGSSFTGTLTYSLLSPGPHNIRVQTSAGCISPMTFVTINAQPATPTIDLGSVTNSGCSTTAVGSITVIGGGAPGLTYTIAGPTVNTTGQTSGIFTSLLAGNYIVTVHSTSGCSNSIAVTVGGPASIFPDITLGSDISGNFFPSNGDINTVVYNISEVAGNPATGDTLRITRVPNYIITFNHFQTANSLSPLNTLDNPRWRADFSNPSFVALIFEPFGTGIPGTLNCSERVFLEINFQRNTPNISQFFLSARLRRANGETFLVNNLNSILFFAE